MHLVLDRGPVANSALLYTVFSACWSFVNTDLTSKVIQLPCKALHITKKKIFDLPKPTRLI